MAPWDEIMRAAQTR